MYVVAYETSSLNFTITTEIRARSMVIFLLSICGQTHEFLIYATRQRARAGDSTICYRKKQIDFSLNAFVLLLTINFAITLAKYSANPLGYRLVDPQIL